MRKRQNRKASFSAALAAVMVLTMAVPGLPAYGAGGNYGDAAKIIFDPQLGPGMEHSTYGKGDPDGSGRLTADGQMGYKLAENTAFSGIATEDTGSGPRPVVPGFGADVWDGYTFDHWEEEDGTRLTRLPFAFQYQPVTTYKAIWKGSDSKTYPFRVEYFRALDGSTGWPQPADYSDPAKIRRFFEPSWSLPAQKANTTVSATYRRDIPGYKLDSVLLKNDSMLKFDGSPFGAPVASINPTTHAVKGHMPNAPLTVAYRYVPDTSKKFTITVNTVKEETVEGAMVVTPIAPPQVSTYTAEEAYDIVPPAFDYYEIDGAKDVKVAGAVSGALPGETDTLPTKGVVRVGEAGCVHNPSSNEIKGKMPNQNISVTYTYRVKPNVKTMIFLVSKDEKGNVFPETEGQSSVVGPLTPHHPETVPIPRRTGFEYPPYITWSGDLSNMVDHLGTDQTLQVTPGIAGGTLTLVYSEDHTNGDYWALLEFYKGSNGYFAEEGFKSTRFIKRSLTEEEPGVRLGDLTAQLMPTGEEHYVFDGWYRTTNGTVKTGPKLNEEDRISESTKLYAGFKEKPGDWVDVSFQAGPHGGLGGAAGKASLHVVKNTPWTGSGVPHPEASEGFVFSGWVREDGSLVTENTELFSGDETYTAKFTPSYNPVTLPVIPDAGGGVSADGTGEIWIKGANVNRSYAVADSKGEVLAVKTGLEIYHSRFTQLKPGEVYRVYELAQGTNPAVGTSLPEGLDENLCSLPALITIPAIGNNYSMEAAGNEGVRLKISPAAPGTVYAVLTEEGQALNDGENGGWVIPVQSEAVFTGLEANQSYVVVAKQASETGEAVDKRLMGTQVLTPPASEESQGYTVSLLGGGYIKEIKDESGSILYTQEEGETKTSALVRPGDRIWIDAPAAVTSSGAERGFSRWSYLIGSTDDATILLKRNPKFTMPKGNLVMRPEYAPATVAGTGSLLVDYAPKNGQAALDLSDEGLLELGANAEDEEAFTHGTNVKYTVKFNRHLPTATESNAVKEQYGGSGQYARAPWSLDLSLARQVGGNNAPLPEGGDFNPSPEVTVYAEIDRNVQTYADYKLFRAAGPDPDGVLTLTEVEKTPLEGEDGAFTGMITFRASVGSRYIMSYLKAYKITIQDSRHPENNKSIYVAPGLALDHTEEYAGLNREGYTDIHGAPYAFQGFAIAGGSGSAYDESQPVLKNLILEAVYVSDEDLEWQKSWKRLKDLVDEANGVRNNLSEGEMKESLGTALGLAHAALMSDPRVEKEILDDHYASLRELLASVGSSGDQQGGGGSGGSGGSSGSSSGSGSGSGGGSSSSSGGSSSGGSSGSGGGSGKSHGSAASGFRFTGTRALGPSNYFGGYKTYFAGPEGYWKKDGAEWSFILKDESRARRAWVNVVYNDARHLCTYYFNGDGSMSHGWLKDAGGNWYYLNETRGADYGRLKVGWHLDTGSGNWYYLNQLNGIMTTGWQQVGNDWYYLSPSDQAGHPMGSLYTDAVTPDGYPVDHDGRWLRDMPGL